MSKSATQYGVQHPDENDRVERITEEDANTGYMSALEYAERRAEASGGFVVTRTKTVSYTDWTPVDPAKAAAVRKGKVETAVDNLRDTLLSSGYSTEQADAILAGVHDTLAVTEP